MHTGSLAIVTYDCKPILRLCLSVFNQMRVRESLYIMGGLTPAQLGEEEETMGTKCGLPCFYNLPVCHSEGKRGMKGSRKE